LGFVRYKTELEVSKHELTDNHAAPVFKNYSYIQSLVRFCADHRFKLHVPPRVRNTANSFRF